MQTGVVAQLAKKRLLRQTVNVPEFILADCFESAAALQVAGGVIGFVRHTGNAKCAAAFRTLVAPATMPALPGCDAGETQMQRQLPTPLNDLLFAQRSERRANLEFKTERNAGHPREISEEFRRRIGKRIMAECADRDDRDFVEFAKHRGLRQ